MTCDLKKENQGKTDFLQSGNQEITWQSGIGNKTRKWPGNYLETGQEPSSQPAKSTRRAEAARNIHRNFLTAAERQ
jgi:hypothetical protein